jgi:hypothetical protein
MPIYEIKSPSGEVKKIESSQPPTTQQVKMIFEQSTKTQQQKPNLLDAIGSLGQSIGNTLMPGITRFGKGIGQSFGLISPDAKNAQQSQQNLLGMQPQLQERARQAMESGDTETAQRLLKLAQEQSQMVSGQAQQRQQDIQTATTDVLKGAPAAALDVASYLGPLPGGQSKTALGRIGKATGRGVITGAEMGASRGLSDDKNILEETAKGALIGGVTSGLFQGGIEGFRSVYNAAKPAVSSALNRIGELGDELIASQYNVPRSVAQQNRMMDTVKSIADDGFTKIDDVQIAANKVTGSDGIVTKYTREAVAKANDVDINGVGKLAKDLVDDPLIPPGQDKKLLKELNKVIVEARKGKLDKADPTVIYDTIQKLEKKAAKLGYSGPYSPVADPAKEAIAGVYKQMADEFKDRLFINNADDVLVGSLKDKLVREMAAISPKLGEKASGVKNIAELRSIAAPYVRASKLINSTEAGKQALQASFGDVTKGLGKFINPIKGLETIAGSESVSVGAGNAIRGLSNISKEGITKTPVVSNTAIKTMSAIERAISRENDKKQEKKLLR